MAKSTYLLLLPLFLVQLAFGQQQYTGAKLGSISGTIIDAETKKGIEYATISLHLVNDSSLVTGTTAKSDGSFELSKVNLGKYYLRIGFIGYQAKYVPNVNLTKELNEIELGVIALSGSYSDLQEVEVTAEKRQMETMIDKKIFNVDKTPAAAGGDGLEVLRNVPSVEVDIDGNISLRGESNVNILVDGRPINMSASQYLQSVPASSIEKIELITNPSAKYDPEGTSGIINIIMKKDRKGGFNGSLNSSIGHGIYTKTNNSLALNYRKGKFNVSSSLSANLSKTWYGGNNDRDIFLPDTNFYQTTRDSGFNKNNNLTGKIGLDYFLNNKTTLYFSGTVMDISGNGERKMNYLNYTSERNLVNESGRDAFAEYTIDGYALNGGVQHKFEKEGHTLDLDINYSDNDQATSEKFSQQFIDPNGESFEAPLFQRQSNTELRSVFNSRLDYVNPLTDSVIFEAGFHTTLRDFDNDIYLDQQDSTGTYQPIDSLNNRFLYDETVYALYTTLSKEFKKWTLKGGLRYEYTGIRGKLVNTGEEAKPTYNSLFPSAYISYKLSPTNNVQVSYTRRINRPSENQLNPFASYADPYTIRTGNPFLRPEYIDVYELGYNSYGKKVNINASVYMRKVNDRIGRFLQLNENGTNVVLFRNFDDSYVYGSELILTYNPFSWWRTTTSFNYWHSKFSKEGILENVVNLNNNGYSVFFNSMHNLKKGWILQWNVMYRGKMKVLQGNITPMYGMDLSARKSILNNKGSISLRVSDIFNMRRFGFESMRLENYQYETLRRWESRTVYLSFNYNFGKQDMPRINRRRNDNRGGDDLPSTGF
ncbi:outer membrane beta-barrel family protein [Luteibaculum oceani]|nr:outer membrane beta-barrel family protein [Luteibaculum oceani]